MYKNYIGHPLQTAGVEEYRMVGGKADSMRFFHVRNGLGLDFTISADRCADIARMSFQGLNMGYLSPCGYVAPTYYDKEDAGFLKSFTAGFLTTCGLNNIGVPSEDEGEALGLHGTISHTPAEHIYYTEDAENIIVHAVMRDARIFRQKLLLCREFRVSKTENKFQLIDTVENEGSTPEPVMLLYHVNLGYPLLDEHAFIKVSSDNVEPRDSRAAEGIAIWDKMQAPEANFEEQCYYHSFHADTASAKLFSPSINKGLSMTFDTDSLNLMTEWKMMGEKDYVLGLEPCNHKLYGRKKLRDEKSLKFIEPGQKMDFKVGFDFFDNQAQWEI